MKNYLSLIKFSHTIFAMPFAIIGFFLGIRDTVVSSELAYAHRFSGISMWDKTKAFFQNNPMVFVLVLLCMIFARSAAMAFNRYLDRRYDALNPRTAVREIPAGIITPKNALIFTIICCAAFITCTFFINSICFYLSPIALLVVLGYSYTKRFTALCHIVLGLGLALAPIGAYLAVTGVFHLVPYFFSLAVVFWVSGFDIIYAMQDEKFDKENGLYSMPSKLGGSKALQLSSFLHVLSTAAVVYAGKMGHFGWVYWVAVLVFGGMLAYQHSLVKPDDLKKVNIAFMTANGIASVVFAVLVLIDMFLKNH